ncbi:MAG TPA: hypothetical protein PLN21_04680 [Gemmatales bacterium]|nr:hypothetical protein [Gemmatales bacterium]
MLEPMHNQQDTAQASSKYWRILTEIPYVRLVTVVLLSLVILIGFIRSLTIGSMTPFLLPVLASVLSTVAILLVDLKGRYGTTYTRIGFHAGVMIFLTSFPILAPDTLGDTDETVRFTAGIVLVLCVVGFEIGYWSLRTFLGIPKAKSPFVLVANNFLWVHRLLYFGIAMFVLYLFYIVATTGKSFFSVLFLLRGEMVINPEETIFTPNDNSYLIAGVLAYGRYLAAAAATIIILSPNPYRLPTSKTIAWLSLIGCAFIGLNSGSGGSRSSFLLSSVPLFTTLWIYSGTIKALKMFRPLVIVVVLFLVLFGIQYLTANRDMGKHLQDEQIGFHVENVNLFEISTLSSLEIYSDYELVISKIPSRVEFQNGASLVPIVLGWVPRRFWPEKPWPFSKIAAELRGFALWTTSIAPGFPAGNFGLTGALLWGALLGLACALADYRMSNLRPGHPLALALRGMMTVWVAIIVRGGTAEMFYMGFFPIGFMWVCLYFSEPRLQKSS